MTGTFWKDQDIEVLKKYRTKHTYFLYKHATQLAILKHLYLDHLPKSLFSYFNLMKSFWY